uniref:Alanine--glyoxylate aminotransferase 2, mitochondrial n=1 Tax=Megaselia scalaris TaxID=36166 RepID=T1GN78_MEGSC
MAVFLFQMKYKLVLEELENISGALNLMYYSRYCDNGQGIWMVASTSNLVEGIGNGFPMAAVVTTPKIAECLSQALHFNTYGGNPLASTVGISVLDIIEKEELQKNCLEVGTYFLKGLAELRDRYEIVGDVRGKGLMIG